MVIQENRIPAYGTEAWSQRYSINDQTPVPPNYDEIRRLREIHPTFTLDFYEAKSRELVEKGLAGLPVNRMLFTRAKQGRNIQFGALVNLAQIYECPVEDIAILDKAAPDGPKRYMPIEFRKTIERFFLISLITAFVVLAGSMIAFFYMELDEARLTVLFFGGVYCLLIGTFFASRKGLVLPIVILVPVGLLFGLIASLLSYVFVLQFSDDSTVNLLRSPNYILIDVVFVVLCAMFVAVPRIVRQMRPLQRSNLPMIMAASLVILIAGGGWFFVLLQTLEIQAAL